MVIVFGKQDSLLFEQSNYNKNLFKHTIVLEQVLRILLIIQLRKIRTDKTLTSEVVAFALSEIEYWLEKYKIIKELVGVVNKQEFERLKKKFEIKEK